MGSKIDTENCWTIRVQSWAGDRDEIHFEPPKLAVGNLDPRSSAINHEISLVHYFYFGTKIKLETGSELGSFDPGIGKDVGATGHKSRPNLSTHSFYHVNRTASPPPPPRSHHRNRPPQPGSLGIKDGGSSSHYVVRQGRTYDLLHFNDLQDILYSLMNKYADINCTLVVCCLLTTCCKLGKIMVAAAQVLLHTWQYGARCLFLCKSAIGSESSWAFLMNCNPIVKELRQHGEVPRHAPHISARLCWMSLGMVVTILAWMAPRFFSSNSSTPIHSPPTAPSPSSWACFIKVYAASQMSMGGIKRLYIVSGSVFGAGFPIRPTRHGPRAALFQGATSRKKTVRRKARSHRMASRSQSKNGFVHIKGTITLIHLCVLGNSGAVARALASHHGFTPGFSNVGIVLDDAACLRVFSEYSRFSHLAFQRRSIRRWTPTCPSWKARHSETHNHEMLRADKGEVRGEWSSAGMQRRAGERSPRKPTDQRHLPVRLAKIRDEQSNRSATAAPFTRQVPVSTNAVKLQMNDVYVRCCTQQGISIALHIKAHEWRARRRRLKQCLQPAGKVAGSHEWGTTLPCVIHERGMRVDLTSLNGRGRAGIFFLCRRSLRYSTQTHIPPSLTKDTFGTAPAAVCCPHQCPSASCSPLSAVLPDCKTCHLRAEDTRKLVRDSPCLAVDALSSRPGLVSADSLHSLALLLRLRVLQNTRAQIHFRDWTILTVTRYKCLPANHGHSVSELPNSDWPSQVMNCLLRRRHEEKTLQKARNVKMRIPDACGELLQGKAGVSCVLYPVAR
ncbi:hypothetical protein PR048_022130 [Dryococelus australis]|uniref:Uncharacterized protein n=1 Tax=Dryococelus australis TaxID=614101 RepID=A0ABQ9H088_9NEOP|nr:hypothetical protein PR048_022130 [Dryococelus australis]